MFCLNHTIRYFLCPGKTDMRKGMDSLCRVIHYKIGDDVRLGDIFIFINRQRTLMKLLHAENGGLLLYIKRLEERTFRLPNTIRKANHIPYNGVTWLGWSRDSMMNPLKGSSD